MRRTLSTIVAAAVGVLALTGTAAAKQKLPPLKLSFASDLIVPGQSVAGITLGGTLTQALAAIGNPPASVGDCSNSGVCTYGLRDEGRLIIELVPSADGTPPTGASLVGGVIIEAPATGAVEHYTGILMKLHTAQGIGLGSSRAKVAATYPTVYAKGGAIRFTINNKVTAFELSQNRVYSITVT